MGEFHRRLRVVSVVGAASAGVLALVGSLVPRYTAEIPMSTPGGRRVTLSLTTWGVDSDWDGDGPSLSMLVPAAVNGYPLVFAAILLLAAAVVSARSAAGRPVRLRAAAVVTASGAAFLAGVGWAVGMATAAFAKTFELPAGDPLLVPTAIGPGVWLLVAAGVLAVAAAVAAWLRTREPEPAGPAADEATPPFGIPVVMPDDPPAGPDRP